MTNKKVLISSLIAIIIIAAVGVVVLQQTTPQNTNDQKNTISVIDDIGKNITLTDYPIRIVSLAPSATEAILGLDLGDRLIGTANYTGYSQAVKNTIAEKNITVVGTFNKINVEVVIGLQPDLIIASGTYQQTLAAKFEEQGKIVIFTNPKNFTGILSAITMIGKATGQEDKAAVIVNEMNNKAQEISEKVNGLGTPSVYVEYYLDQMGFSCYGANSYVNELISIAGGVNVFANSDSQYVSTNTEEVINANPSIIVISKGVMSSLVGITPESMQARDGWGNIEAVQEGKIFEIDESLLTIWGPRIMEGLEELAEVIHPEAFN
ncbi:MAG: ABC transporter substrate-binding protein [Crenarchaeota archaeon]|nr:ABC transporter substrate-binding protein [Thermoproteota archaeon]